MHNMPSKIIESFWLLFIAGFNSKKGILLARGEFKQLIHPYMDQFMGGFPLIEWIDSKIQNKGLTDIIKQNYLKAVADDQQ